MILTVILSIAVLAFLGGITRRIIRIASMPIHVRWELYPMPEGAVGRTCFMISEIFLLKGVHKHNRVLWLWSWLFHTSLYLLIGIAGLSLVASFSEKARDSITTLIAIVSFAAFVCGILGTSGLMALRLASPGLRLLTSIADLFNLTLLFGIFLSGLCHSLLQPAAASIMVEQAGSLLWLNSTPALHPVAYVHLCLIALFVSYMPFTQMAHMVLKYFTYHSVRWDDRPVGEVPENADRMAEYLAYPVGWSASHIQGGKTSARWSDVVADKTSKEQKVEKH